MKTSFSWTIFVKENVKLKANSSLANRLTVEAAHCFKLMIFSWALEVNVGVIS